MSEHISPIDLAVLGAYLLMMLGVGYIIFRKAPSFEEFLLAGRTMTTPILICTLASTYYGLDVLFGTSELAYNDGVVAFFGYSELSLGIYLFAAYALSTTTGSAPVSWAQSHPSSTRFRRSASSPLAGWPR